MVDIDGCCRKKRDASTDVFAHKDCISLTSLTIVDELSKRNWHSSRIKGKSINVTSQASSFRMMKKQEKKRASKNRLLLLIPWDLI